MNPQHIMVHHTASLASGNPDQFIATNNYHKSKNFPISSLGYYVGYNYEIAKNGKVYKAREPGEVTAACPQEGMNSGKCVHISLDGNMDVEQPTPPQIYALRDLIQDLVLKYAIKKENIVFHNMYANKSCPGSNLDIDFIRSLAGDSAISDPEISDKEDVKAEIQKALENLSALIKKL